MSKTGHLYFDGLMAVEKNKSISQDFNLFRGYEAPASIKLGAITAKLEVLKLRSCITLTSALSHRQ